MSVRDHFVSILDRKQTKCEKISETKRYVDQSNWIIEFDVVYMKISYATKAGRFHFILKKQIETDNFNTK